MRSFHHALVAFLVLNPPFLLPQESQAARERLWSWFGNCSYKRYMALEILRKGEVIHRSSFPICPINDRSEVGGSHKKMVAFFFRGRYVFQGEYHTARTQTIEGNIWQAGTDPGAIWLGLSFTTQKQILLNAIHYAKPGGESISEIDRGLIVRTFPIRRR